MAEPRLCPARPLNCCILQGRNVPPGQVGRCTCPCHEEPPPIRSDAPADESRELLIELAEAAAECINVLRVAAPLKAILLAASVAKVRRYLGGKS